METPPPNGLDDETIAKIRQILADGGVPERSLDWMSRSCPGLDEARAYAAELAAKGRG